MANNDNILGERLKTCRKNHDMTQQEVADKLGVTSASISSWESGARRPDFEMLDNLSKLYDVSFDYLFGRINTVVANSNETLDNFGKAVSAKYDAMMEDSVMDFLSLDAYGKIAVMKLIENELERCGKQNTLEDSKDYTVVVRSARKKKKPQKNQTISS